MNRISWLAITLGILVVGAGNARAACHLAKVVQVFGGTTLCPNAQYVVLNVQAETGYANNEIRSTAAGTPPGTIFATIGAIGTPVADSKVVVGTADAATKFGITFDGTAATANLPLVNGMILHMCSGSSVTYGNLIAANAPALPSDGQALVKTGLTWAAGTAAPVNNAGATGTLSATCLPASTDMATTATDMAPASGDMASTGGSDAGATAGDMATGTTSSSSCQFTPGTTTPAWPSAVILAGLLLAFVARRSASRA